MTFSEDYLTAAHKHSGPQRAEIEASSICGCFYCLQIFPPDEIDMWVNGEQDATCPKCGIDSVIGSASGLPVSDHEFLRAMYDRWFGRIAYAEN
ncbi:MAG TPA: cytoplasmic protein [Allosphingosinicella sp.]|nr:cytoplasmic protein [Allosphingosinicella sp.]